MMSDTRCVSGGENHEQGGHTALQQAEESISHGGHRKLPSRVHTTEDLA